MTTFLLCAAILSSTFAFADMDSASQQALEQTQTLMNSPTARQKETESDPKAKAADAKVREVASDPADQQKMYEISSDIFKSMAGTTNGDVKEQKAMMEKAAADPEGFFNSLTPEQQAQIKSLAAKIQGENPLAGAKP